MDSTHVVLVNKSFDKLVASIMENSTHKSSIWDTIVPLLIGAGLTLLTQFLIEFSKTRKERRKEKQNLISKGQAKVYLISQILRDVAMYKCHKQYYLRASTISLDQNEKEDSYRKHYEKGQEQRISESKLDDNVSEYCQIVREYFILTNKTDHFQYFFQNIFNYVHPKSSRFVNCNNENELVNELQSEESRLNQEYDSFRNIFEAIQSEMK